MLTFLKPQFWSVLWMTYSLLLPLLQCVDLSDMAMQNLVYKFRNIYLTTVANIESPAMHHGLFHHTESYGITFQMSKTQAQMVHWYECYYVIRWPKILQILSEYLLTSNMQICTQVKVNIVPKGFAVLFYLSTYFEWVNYLFFITKNP